MLCDKIRVHGRNYYISVQ